MDKKSVAYMNTTVLAFLGDAVYETYIRNHVMASGQVNADLLHRAAVRFVRADAQAYALKAMMDELTQEEQNLVKRARNKKISTKPKNADPVEYKWATAFEALVGFLHLSGEHGRLDEIVNRTIDLIEGSWNKNSVTKKQKTIRIESADTENDGGKL